MKKLLCVICAAAMMSGLAPVFAQTAGVMSDLGLEVTGDVSYFSQYVWRGFVLDRDEVIQPGFYLSNQDKGYGKLSLKLWSSHDIENEDTLNSDEVDYIVDYTYVLSGVGLSLGHTYYDFTETSTHSKEWYAGVTLPAYTIASLKGTTVSSSVYFYRDYGHPADGGALGTYLVANLGTSTPVTVGKYACSFDLAGHYGWNNELFIAGEGGDLGLQAAFTVPLTPNMTISPNINYSRPFGDLEDPADGNQKTRTYCGMTAKYKF